MIHHLNANLQLNQTEKRLIQNKDLTVELALDETGTVTEATVFGMDDLTLESHIKAVCLGLPPFQPARYNGEPVASNYTFSLNFEQQEYIGYSSYRAPAFEDFEYIEAGEFGLDMYISAMANKHAGIVGEYIGFGSGISVGMLFGTKKISAGFDMSFYGNSLQKDFTINDTRPQNEGPPTLFLGLAATREIKEWEKSSLEAQLNLSYVVMNIISTDGDTKPVQFQGFSPGARLNYVLRLGKPKFMLYYGSPTLHKNAIQFHIGAYAQLMKEHQARGVNFDFGVGYRMKLNSIRAYQMKEGKEIFGY